MTASEVDGAELGPTSRAVVPSKFEDSVGRQAAYSAALVSIFRGKFCEAILANRKHEVIYNVGDKDRTFVFLQNGFVKLGAISPGGHEVIYDVRQGGDVVGNVARSGESLQHAVQPESQRPEQE